MDKGIIIAITPELVFYLKIFAAVVTFLCTLLTVSVSVIGWFLVHTLKRTENTNSKQWESISTLRSDLDTLLSEHDFKNQLCPILKGDRHDV